MIDKEQATKTLRALMGDYERVLVPKERVADIVKLCEVSEPIYKANSLHIWEERYFIAGKTYEILQYGWGEVVEVNELILRPW